MQNFTGVASVPNPNLFISGNFNIFQVVTGTIVAGTALPTTSLGYAPLQSGWFNYAVGADVTTSRLSASGRVQFTGAPGVTEIGVGQRIEGIVARQLTNKTATLSVAVLNSLGLPITWAVYHPTASTDTFGTIANPTKVLIATGTFPATPSLIRHSASFVCPSNISFGMEIIFTVANQTSGVWSIGNAKLEAGATATDFVEPDPAVETLKCQRFFEVCQVRVRGYSLASGAQGTFQQFLARKRAIPVAIFISNDSGINVASTTISPTTIDGFGFTAIATSTGEAFSQQTHSFSAQIP